MSRSFRKQPILVDNGHSKKENRSIANRIIRRKLNNPDFEMGCGSEYKRYKESYDIVDNVFRWTLDDALKCYRDSTHYSYLKEEYPTEEEFIAHYKKSMICK